MHVEFRMAPGCLITFACQPYNYAYTSAESSRNCVYTSCLLSSFRPMISMSQLFKNASILASKNPDVQTTPQIVDSINGDFVFMYDKKFKAKVTNIRKDIMGKEELSIWNVGANEVLTVLNSMMSFVSSKMSSFFS